MDKTLVILIVLIILLFFLAAGHYISSILFACGAIGILILGGWDQMKAFMINEPYQLAASYTLTAIPLYTIMAQFILKSNIISDIYAIVFKVSKGRKGALGTMTMLLGAFLGAVSGSGTATAASLGKIAVPELRSRHYSDALAASVAASAGSLSAVIPPTLMLIVYGSLTEISVAKLFMATLIPGLLTTFVFIILTIIYLNTKAEKKRAAEQATLIEKVEEPVLSKGRTIFVIAIGIALILVIFVGIYTGFFSPTEAGAVGAFLALCITFATKTFSFKMLKEAALETAKVCSMSCFIIMGAGFFSRFVTLSMLPRTLMNSLGGLLQHPALLLFIIMAFYFILYMFVDGSSGMLMTVPVLLPLLREMGVDITWFGIYICMIATMGSMTPPVGLCTYTACGSSGIETGKTFKITVVYAAVTTVVVGGLMIAFPQLATWFPSVLGY